MPVEYFARGKCIELLSKAVYGRLATCGDNGQPYICLLYTSRCV